VFGHTVYAITTVLAAFMAGLALGSYIFAGLAARIRNLIRMYGYLEIAIGIYCALIPALLALEARAYIHLHRAFDFSYDTFSVVQFLMVFALLLVPTTLMGGTLPVLSQALVKREGQLGRQVGILYAANTFGAVVGVVAAGYFLLPALGNAVTIQIAVVANLLVGIFAIAYSLRPAPSAPEAVAAAAAPPAPRPPARPGEAAAAPASALAVQLAVLGLGVSGATSMIYEVAWTRALALVIGSSTYAFTAMLVAFLVGIAGGSAIYSALAGARRVSVRAFGFIQIGIAAAAIAMVLVFERMPELFLRALAWSDSPAFMQVVQLLVSAAALLPSTLLIGATFPCVIAIVGRASRIGEDVGRVYAVNTVGAIAGTMLAGFVLIPAIGVHSTLKVGILLNLLLGVAVVAADSVRVAPRWRWSGLGAAATAVALILVIPPWNPAVMASAPAVYGKTYLREASRSDLQQVLKAQRVLFYRDGRSGTISVDQSGDHIFLRTNGKIDAGTAVDMPTQIMSGHLPMLLHPGARNVLVIGMGSGITAGAVARHPVERLDIVEIEPAVVEASRFFADFHGNVTDDPRVRTIIADGRNFLLTTDRRYDVIVSEPSNPWIGGLASLFSVEFFRLAREHLTPGGLIVQWIQGYNLPPEDLQMVVRTFRAVFPAATVWNTIPGDFLLIGQVDPAPFDLDGMRARYETNPGVWRDLDRIGVRAWPMALGYFMLGEEDAARLSEGTALNTDDRLPLEFSAPRALYMDTTDRNWALVRSFRTGDVPRVTAQSQAALATAEVRCWIGLGYLNRNIAADAAPHFQQGRELDPASTFCMLGAGVASLRMGQPEAALRLARDVLAREPRNGEGYYLAGLASEALHDAPRATALLQRAVSLQPRNQEFRAALARLSGGSALR
jgi:spermidine synthase